MVMESHPVCWRPNVGFRDSFWKAIYLNTFLITLWKIWYNPRSYSFPYCEYQHFMASGIGLSPCPRIWSGIYEPWWNWIILFRITTTIGRKRNPYSDPWHSSRNLGCVVQSFCFGIQLEHINILYTVWYIYIYDWWFGTRLLLFHILGMSSSQLTNSFFFRGLGIPPTRWWFQWNFKGF